MNKKIYIVLDLEATCYDREDQTKPKGFVNEIIEIGAVKCNEAGEVLNQFQCFIKPTKFPIISKFCNELTTITQADVDNAKDFKWNIKEFWNWVYKNIEVDEDVIFVSWGHYDRKQLRQDSKINGLNDDWITEENHISLKHKHAEWNKLKPKGIGLGGACKMEKIVFEGTAHRGIDDAINIAKIFKKYVHKLNG